MGLVLSAIAGGLGGSGGGCASPGERAQAPVTRSDAERLVREGLAAEFIPTIDRLTYFGPVDGPNLLHVTGLDRAPEPDGSYTFFGGAYSWISPQGGAMGWVGVDGVTRQDWPPDPAMDVGPVRRSARGPDMISVVGPTNRWGLREEKTVSLVSSDEARVQYTIRNLGAGGAIAGTWMNTAVDRPSSRLALRMPEGTELYGWNDESVTNLRSVLGEPGPGGWCVIDLRKARWKGGVKVYVQAPAGSPVDIAVWRDGWWFHRELTPMTEAQLARLRENKEGPVAVYIDPRANLVEAELYGAIEDLAPGGGSVTSLERWRLFRSKKPDASALP